MEKLSNRDAIVNLLGKYLALSQITKAAMTILLHDVTVACMLYVTTFHGLLLIVTKNILHQCNYQSICGQHQYIKYWHSGAFELVGYHATN